MKEIEDCFAKVKKAYFKYLNKEKIFNKSKISIIRELKNIYIPISFWINKKYENKGKTLFLGFSGGQGAGKTTVSEVLKLILKKYFKRKTEVISIDNFYKTLKDRNKMSSMIHPLFQTRGVPGTHDLNLIMNFFRHVKSKKFKKFKVPRFDKTSDDRLKKRYWINIKEKPEIVILEGWCVGAKPQLNTQLRKPVNSLEKFEDKSMFWRKFVNKKLSKEYKKVFSKIDHFIFMKVPNFTLVFKWRLLQENKLKKKSHFNKKIMSYNEIKRFIMYYQRITLQMMKDLSKSASIVLFLKKNHEIKKILFRV